MNVKLPLVIHGGFEKSEKIVGAGNQTIVQLYELRQENLATARLINAFDFAAKFDPFTSCTLNFTPLAIFYSGTARFVSVLSETTETCSFMTWLI